MIKVICHHNNSHLHDVVTINDESQQYYYAANFTLKMLWQGGRDVVAAEQQVQQGQRELLQGDSVTPN